MTYRFLFYPFSKLQINVYVPYFLNTWLYRGRKQNTSFQSKHLIHSHSWRFTKTASFCSEREWLWSAPSGVVLSLLSWKGNRSITVGCNAYISLLRRRKWSLHLKILEPEEYTNQRDNTESHVCEGEEGEEKKTKQKHDALWKKCNLVLQWIIHKVKVRKDEK